MKNKISIFAALLILTVGACKKSTVADRTVLSSNPVSSTLKSDVSAASIRATATAVNTNTLTWTKPDYGFSPSSVYYIVQFCKTVNGFTNGTAIYNDTIGADVLTKTYTNQMLLPIALKIGCVPGDSSAIYIRVKNQLAYNFSVAPLYSNITTFGLKINHTNMMYVPGDYQGWSPANAKKLYSANNNLIYTNTFDIINTNGGGTGEFKLTPDSTWDFSYGATSYALSESGSNLKVSPEGTYKITADLNTMTYTAELVNWGIIGSATANGWSGDQAMQYDDVNGVYTITTDLVVGEFKFRKNSDWSVNFGDDGNNLSLEAGGANIPVAVAGNYTIKLNVGAKTYTIVKN